MFGYPGTQQAQMSADGGWSRVLQPPTAQPTAPTSPGFFVPTGRMHHALQIQHHYPSPPAQHVSPATITPHWSQQLLKCEAVRQARSPHHRAKQSALASRTVTKNAITITNPNLIKNGNSDRPPTPQADHPSSTVAPIAEAPRPKFARPENNWNSLDMGGVQIKTLPPLSGLFQMDFLVNLYLNHNALSSVPPQISKLRHLELLDLSGNALQALPPELGMITTLKELYLFDNQINTLPPELGTLHQLQTLGVEGNPLEASLKNMIQKDGTHTLISYLRDSCPVPNPPPPRAWESTISDSERELLASDPTAEVFSVLCYNILSEKCATESLYGYTPAWALAWEYRKELILNEIVGHDADIICLQEVEVAQFEEYFTKHLGDRGYQGVFSPKLRFNRVSESDKRSVEGCATFFRHNKYKLIEKRVVEFRTIAMSRQDFKKTDDMFNRVLGKEHVAVVCLLERIDTGSRLVLANMHIEWNPVFKDVKLVQVALLVEEVQTMADELARYPPRRPDPDDVTQRPPPTYSEGTKIPIIIAGDFNSIPDSGVYEFLSTGSLPANHPDFMNHKYGVYTEKGLRHNLNLKSAYSQSKDGDLSMTNFTPSFKGGIDYVWFSAGTVGVSAVLGKIDGGYLEKVVGFPNVHFPSDHICIMSEFRVKPQRALNSS